MKFTARSGQTIQRATAKDFPKGGNNFSMLKLTVVGVLRGNQELLADTVDVDR